MGNTFQITTYKPNKELILKSEDSSDKLIYFVIATSIFLTTCFTAITATLFPVIIFGVLAIISWFGLKNQFAKLITFTTNHLIIEYKIGLMSWENRYDNIMELDWFVDVNQQPAKIKIGYKEKVIVQFKIDNLETLPLLTQNVSELLTMEVDMNETVGRWENIRFRSKKQLPNYTEFHYLKIQQNTSELSVTSNFYKLEIDLQNGQLKYTKWLISKTVDLKNIKAIYYYFDRTTMTDEATTHWAYVDKKTNEIVTFFKFRRSTDQYEETHYTQLNFKIDNRNLARLLQDLSVFQNIEIIEKKWF